MRIARGRELPRTADDRCVQRGFPTPTLKRNAADEAEGVPIRKKIAIGLLCAATIPTIAFSPNSSDSAALNDCANGVCTMRMTAPQLLTEAEKLVQARRFDEARPLLAALNQAPEMKMQAHFLSGYVNAETGDLHGAEREFRTVLEDRPDLTRARLELARVLMLEGKDAAADHHYRLAEEAKDLPPEIRRTIIQNRGIIRSRKNWYGSVDFGIAPDTNITNATKADTIDFAGQTLVLDPSARQKSGVGQTAGFSGGVKLRLRDGLAMAVDADGRFTNYKGTNADDISAMLAIGPELTLKGKTTVTVQGLAYQRWYGGKSASTAGGVRVSVQKELSAGSKLGIVVDLRKSHSGFSRAYSGWEGGVYASYERVINRSMIASFSGFARREKLKSPIYSNTEVGGSVGIGGELPHGINAGVSAGVSRAVYDKPMLLMSPDKRMDWRLNARAYVGLRSVRVFGFSPSLTYTYQDIISNQPLYKAHRHRVMFGVARYF